MTARHDSLALVLDSMRFVHRLTAERSPRGTVVEQKGVLAAIVPAMPSRSVVNCVLYDEAGELGAALEDLARAYEEAGVHAWTVWVPEAEREAATLLEAAGHRLDAEPTAMLLELDSFEPGPETVELAPAGAEELAALNAAAYGWEVGGAADVMAGLAAAGAHLYLVSVDGRPASCLATIDHGSDCGIEWVATAETARRRGLATALLRRALADARERGCETSTLVATPSGRPVYERIGYRGVGALGMWERRRPEGAS